MNNGSKTFIYKQLTVLFSKFIIVSVPHLPLTLGTCKQKS